MDKSIGAGCNLSDESISDESESPSNNNSKNLDLNDCEEIIDFSDKRDLNKEESKQSKESGEEADNAQKNPALEKMDEDSVNSSKPDKNVSIFDFDDDDVFLQSKSDRKAGSQEPEKIENRRSSKIFDLKRKSTTSGPDVKNDMTDKGGKKTRRSTYPLRSMSQKRLLEDNDNTEPGVSRSKMKKSGKLSTSQVMEAERIDDSSGTEIETREELETEAEEFQRKHRTAVKRQSAHNQRILRVINEGSEEQLRTLSRVGPKTATMIYHHRKIHGRLSSISDLKDLPGWSSKVYVLFLMANNVVLD